MTKPADQFKVPAELPVVASSWHHHTAVLAGHAGRAIAPAVVTQPSAQAMSAARGAVAGTSTKLAGRSTTNSTKVTTADAVFVSSEATREAALSINSLLA